MEPDLLGLDALVFLPASSASGLPVDQVRLLILMAAALPLAVAQRSLPPGAPRHVFSVVFGLVSIVAAYNWYALNNIVSSVGAYALMRLLPTRLATPLTCAWLFVACSASHIWTLFYNYMGWTMDFTGTQMILTVKLSWLVLNLHDGRKSGERRARLADDNARDAILPSEAPSLLEWLSYTLWYPTVLIGPAFLYRGYRDWAMSTDAVPRGRWQASGWKFLAGISLMALFQAVKTLVPPERVAAEPPEPSILDFPLPLRLLYTWIAVAGMRVKYFFVWYIADAACILSGLGHNGAATPQAGDRVRAAAAGGGGGLRAGEEGVVTEVRKGDNGASSEYVITTTRGAASCHAGELVVQHRGWYAAMFLNSVDGDGRRWDRCSNGNYWRVETAQSCKDVTDNWNLGVSCWLKNCFYVRLVERLGHRSKAPVLGTQAVSAFWHGFYPGYYLFFFSTAAYVEVARRARRTLRPIFAARGVGAKRAYDFFCWLFTQIGLNCLGVPFVFLRVDVTLRVWRALWWLPHIVPAAVLVACLALRRRGGNGHATNGHRKKVD